VNSGFDIFGAKSYLLKLQKLQKGTGNLVLVTSPPSKHKMNNNATIKRSVAKISC